MRKIIPKTFWAALVLVVCMASSVRGQAVTLPAGLMPAFGAGPASAPAGPRNALKPYVAFAWSPTERLKHIMSMCWITPNTNPLELAMTSRKIPAGCRVLVNTQLTEGLLSQRDDRCRDAAGNPTLFAGLWPDRGVLVVAGRVDAFFATYAKAGGQCDLLALDFEENFSNWMLAPERLRAIVADPRFGPIRDQLAFADLHGPEDLVERVHDWRKYQKSGEYLRWNSVTEGLVTDALNRAVANPVRRSLPGANMCNYDGVVWTQANAVWDLNGHHCYYAGALFGNYQAPSCYGQVGGIGGVVPGDWKSPFTSVLRSVNQVRACLRSSSAPVIPWIAFRSYAGDDPAHPIIPWVNTDYYQENLYHLMLSGASNNLLYFNPRTTPFDMLAKPAADDVAVDAALTELERQAHGQALKKALLTDAVEYTVKCLASAAVTDDDRTVARVSFAPNVDEADVTIAGKTMHVKCPAGQVGVWVEVK